MSKSSDPLSRKKVFRFRYLIDRDFQLKYAFLISLTALIVALLIGTVVFYSLKESIDILRASNLSSRPEIQSLTHQWSTFLRYNLVIILCGSVAFLTLFGIFMTHKMVGPILVLKRRLKEMSEGNFNTPMRLRKNDEFQDMKEQFNTMLSSLQSRLKQEVQFLERVHPTLSDESVKTELGSLIQKKKQSLGGLS